MQVDSENRLVADSLEAEWNARLHPFGYREARHALAEAQQEYERQRCADRLIVDDKERERIGALASNFPAVWANPNTPHRERKRMLALLIEDVTLIKQRHVTAAVRFRGGATTTLTLPRPLTQQQLRATHVEVRDQIDALLNEYTDAQIVHVINERGLKTGAGDAFTPESIQWLRFSAKLKTLKQRLLEAGMCTSKQMTANFGHSRHVLSRLRLQGKIKARICNDHGEWLYWPPDRPSDSLAPQFAPPITSTARGAV